MPRIRYTGDTEELAVAPAGKPGFTVRRLEWIDVESDVAKGLLQQPDWETETKASRAKTEKES